MHWSPFLEIFVGLFLLLGFGLGWFTRLPVVVIGLGAWILVFATLLIGEQATAYEPWNWDIDAEAFRIYALLGLFAAVPALLTALAGRLIKRWRTT